MANLTESQRELLEKLAGRAGVIWVRGAEAETAIGMARTPYVALGPTETSGAVTAAITAEGRTILRTTEAAHG